MDICQVGGRFSRCRATAFQTCQYCGRDFCREHAYFVEDHEAVCDRKHCRAKRDDLVVHTAYRGAVGSRNRAGVCGIEPCEEAIRAECSLCRGRFCREHIAERSYPFADRYGSVSRKVSVCGRCWERRKIWKRVG